MTKYTAIDYSEGPIPGAILKANGITDVFRYITNPKWPKSLSAPEVRDLKASGINIHLLYEETADYMLSGYTGGMRCAQYSRMLATGLGFGIDEPIIHSADFDASTAQTTVLLDFLMGAEFQDKSRARVAAYAGYYPLKAIIDRGYVGMQAAGWAYGRKENRAMAWQSTDQMIIGGIRVDGDTMNPAYVKPVPTLPPGADSYLHVTANGVWSMNDIARWNNSTVDKIINATRPNQPSDVANYIAKAKGNYNTPLPVGTRWLIPRN